MPRTTRAALRSKELPQEEAIAAAVPLPTTPQIERVPLGEITDNKGSGLIMIDSAENEPVKQEAKKGRKAKGAKKGKKNKTKDIEEPETEVLEDGNQSSASSAAEEAREELINKQGAQTMPLTDGGPQAPSCPAANMASKQMTPKPNLQFDPEVRQPSAEEAEINDADKSFEAKIEIRTPKKPTEQVDNNNREAKEDSFVEQIKSRSPAKRISRIEDSVEALDKFEEEIEKAGQAITPPPAADGLPTPSKANTSTKAKNSGKVLSKANGTSKVHNALSGTKKDLPKVTNGASKPLKRPSIRPTDVKPKENRASLLRQGIKPASPARALRAAAPVASKKAPAPTAPVEAPTLPAKRVNSVTKPPFQPAKSTKAPTQSSFELPGEAISRRLKEQREERLKREEKERSEKLSFKARPVRLSQAPEVRMTTATQARLSMAKQATTETSQNPTKRPSPLRSSTSSQGTNKRMSSLTIAKHSNPLANSNAKRAPSRSSVSGEPRAAPTAEDLAHQKVKGKEAFTRPKNEMAAREKVRKEKEGAAKRARIEAAERGRIASREWAEKQKAKKMAEMSAKKAATA